MNHEPYDTDEKNLENDELNEILLNHAEHEVFFHINYFIKFLMYHLIFFCFGPFVVPIISYFDSLNMARNMRFYGLNKVVAI